MKVKSLKDLKISSLKNRTVLLRVDFNVPLDDGRVVDDYKIISSLPTIRFLIRYKARVVIISHLGRPDGKRKKEFSLKPVASRLATLLGQRVVFVDDCVGLEVGTKVSKVGYGEVVVLENLRFYKEEQENEVGFAKSLASLADFYINDAFGVSHRKDSSLAAVKKFLPSYAGLLLEKEVVHLHKVLEPGNKVVSIIGGAKLETKIELIKMMSKKSYRVLVGGALANSFLCARGYRVGGLGTDKENVKLASAIKSKNIILPVDLVVNGSGNSFELKKVGEVKTDEEVMDIGPETIKLYTSIMKKAEVIAWNGPMGKFEETRFKQGTVSMARSVASCKGAFSVVGGGETEEAVKISKMSHFINWVSTGGGAMLTFLSGEKMPGLEGIVKK